MCNTTTIHDGGAEYSADSAAPSDDDTRVHRLGSAATTYDRSAEYSADSAPPTGDCFSVYRQCGAATTYDYSAAPAADEPGTPSEIQQLATSLREMGQNIAQGSHQNINHLTQATADQARILGHEIQEMVDATLSDQHQRYLDSTKRVEQNIDAINDQYLGDTQRQGRRIDQVASLIDATERSLEERRESVQRDIQAHAQNVARVQRLAQQQTETRPSTTAQKKAPATANYVPRRRPQTTSQTGPNPNPPTGTAPSQPAKAAPPQATHQAIPNGQLRRNPSIEPQSTPEAPPSTSSTTNEEPLPPLAGNELWQGTERVWKMIGTFTPKGTDYDERKGKQCEEFPSFAKRFEHMAEFYEIPRANWAQMFAACLATNAHDEYLAMSKEQQNDFDQTIEHLGKIYPAPMRNEWTYRIQWDALRQGQDEPLRDFVGRIESLAHKAHTSLNPCGLEFEKIMKFRHGLASSFLRYDLAIVTAETLQELGERAIMIQLKRNSDPATMWARTTEASDVARDLGITPIGIVRTAQFEPQQSPMVEVTRLPYVYPDTMPPATTCVTYVSASSLAVPATPPPPTPSYNPPTQPPPGHPQGSEQRRQQPKDEGYPKKRRGDYQRGMDLASIRCYNCGELGHLANKCSRPDKRLQRNYRGGNRGRGSRGGNRANSYTDNRQSSEVPTPPVPTPERQNAPLTEQSSATQDPIAMQCRAHEVSTNADHDLSMDDVGFDLLMSSDSWCAMIRFAGADLTSPRSKSPVRHTQARMTEEETEQSEKLSTKQEKVAPPATVREVPKPCIAPAANGFNPILIGMTTLHYAVWQNTMEPVSVLLQKEASVTALNNEGSTALHIACQHGHADIVALLLYYGADPILVNKQRKTPFDLACEYGRVKVLQSLIESRPCVRWMKETRNGLQDIDNTTPLHLAAKNGYVDVIKCLVDACMDVNRKVQRGSALHESVLFGKVDSIAFLLAIGADVAVTNNFQQTPLDLAKKHCKSSSAKDIKFLLKEATNAVYARTTQTHSAKSQEELTFGIGEILWVIEHGPEKSIWRGLKLGPKFSARLGSFSSSAVQVVDRKVAMQRSQSHRQVEKVGIPEVPDAQSPLPTTPKHRVHSSAYGSVGHLDQGVHSSTSGESRTTPVHQSNSCAFAYPPRNRSPERSTSMPSPPSRNSYHSSGSSSLGSLDRLDETGTYVPPVNVAELLLNGVPDHEIIQVWLQSLHYEEYIALFLNAGYDLPTVTRMTPEDLTAIGITKPGHRKRLTTEIHKMGTLDNLPYYKPASLREWLRVLRLGEYTAIFENQGYRTINDVSKLTWEDLEDVGVKKLGYLKKLGLAMKRLKEVKNSQHYEPDHQRHHPQGHHPQGHVPGEAMIISVGHGPRLAEVRSYSHVPDRPDPYSTFNGDYLSVSVNGYPEEPMYPEAYMHEYVPNYHTYPFPQQNGHQQGDCTPTLKPKLTVKPRPVAKVVAKTKRPDGDVPQDLVYLELPLKGSCAMAYTAENSALSMNHGQLAYASGASTSVIMTQPPTLHSYDHYMPENVQYDHYSSPVRRMHSHPASCGLDIIHCSPAHYRNGGMAPPRCLPVIPSHHYNVQSDSELMCAGLENGNCFGSRSPVDGTETGSLADFPPPPSPLTCEDSINALKTIRQSSTEPNPYSGVYPRETGSAVSSFASDKTHILELEVDPSHITETGRFRAAGVNDLPPAFVKQLPGLNMDHVHKSKSDVLEFLGRNRVVKEPEPTPEEVAAAAAAKTEKEAPRRKTRFGPATEAPAPAPQPQASLGQQAAPGLITPAPRAAGGANSELTVVDPNALNAMVSQQLAMLSETGEPDTFKRPPDPPVRGRAIARLKAGRREARVQQEPRTTEKSVSNYLAFFQQKALEPATATAMPATQVEGQPDKQAAAQQQPPARRPAALRKPYSRPREMRRRLDYPGPEDERRRDEPRRRPDYPEERRRLPDYSDDRHRPDYDYADQTSQPDYDYEDQSHHPDYDYVDQSRDYDYAAGQGQPAYAKPRDARDTHASPGTINRSKISKATLEARSQTELLAEARANTNRDTQDMREARRGSRLGNPVSTTEVKGTSVLETAALIMNKANSPEHAQPVQYPLPGQMPPRVQHQPAAAPQQPVDSTAPVQYPIPGQQQVQQARGSSGYPTQQHTRPASVSQNEQTLYPAQHSRSSRFGSAPATQPPGMGQ